MDIFFWTLGGLALSVLLILLIRTAYFRPEAKKEYPENSYDLNTGKIIERFVSLIGCRTVSSNNEALVDTAEFDRFRALLQEFYPCVFRNGVYERIGKTGILITIKGIDSGSPSVLMSHYDVVPAVKESWEKDPFEGIVEDGVIWGRGTLDTKGTLCGIMEAAEMLLLMGFVPKNDIYLAFSGDEEIAGDSAPAIVAELQKRKVFPALVVDEGGAVVDGVFPGVKQTAAFIGTAEKGMLDLRFKVKSKGGHASSPPAHTPVGVLAEAVVKIEKKPFRLVLTPPVKALFDNLGRHSTYLYRLIFANLWLFSPLLDLLGKTGGGELNAMMRTTCAFTMMEGSNASNVIPPEASVGANLRIISGQTYEEAVRVIKGIVKDDDIEYEVLYGMNPSPVSSVDGEGYEKLTRAISETWPGVLISPYLMFACSDSRHYHQISDYVYRFSAVYLTKEQRGLVHSNNERIEVKQLMKIVEFYLNLISLC